LPERYAVARLVFQRLTNEVFPPPHADFAWELRMVRDGQLNAYSSPDGAIYVDSGLAELAAASAGLWSAVLSHEISHVIHRDWARRYLYRKSLGNGGGDPASPDLRESTWIDSGKASENLARFCREQETEADRAGVMLMARAGYHPDFVPALHHLLRAHAGGAVTASIYAMHPGWDTRDNELKRAYVAASIDFDHRWPDWYASPGGDPPVLVFAQEPSVRRSADGEWEIQLPLHCENLVGAVEAVLLPHSNADAAPSRTSHLVLSRQNVRQLSGCTSPKTTITFTLPAQAPPRDEPWTDVYVLDDRGSILSRTELPRFR
jgi:Peptidase family M48